MANPTCTRATLLETNPGFGGAGFDRNQAKAAAIYFMAAELAAIGGTNYLSAMTTTLVEDATTLAGSADPNQYFIGLMNVARNNAVAAGASVSDNLSTINAQTGCCFQSIGPDGMDWIILLLLCRLGVHKAYPQ